MSQRDASEALRTRIYGFLQAHPEGTPAYVVRRSLSLTETRARGLLSRMREDGHIVCHGLAANARWYALCDKPAAPAVGKCHIDGRDRKKLVMVLPPKPVLELEKHWPYPGRLEIYAPLIWSKTDEEIAA